MTGDVQLTDLICTMLENRRFFVAGTEWEEEPLATTTKRTPTGKCAGTDVVQHLHQRPAHTPRHSQLHLRRRLLHRVARKRLQQHRSVTHVCPEHYDHLLRHKPTACEPFKDTGVCFPPKKPISQTRTECSVERYQTLKHNNTSPTRLLPNHLGLPQTNELGQCTPTGRYRSSSHQEDCCLPHGTRTTNDRHQLFHHQPAASRLKSRKSFMRTVTPLDSSASSSRLRLWKDSLTDAPASVKMRLEVAESLPAGSGEDWLCWRALNRLRTGVGRAKTVMRRWGYLDDAQSVDCDCGEPQTMAHLLSCRLLDEACTAEDLATVTERAMACARKWEKIV